jgi:hypothetical protein
VRDWRVRTKLGAVLTIPAVAFLAIAGIQTNAAVKQSEALQQYTRQVHLSRQITALVHELQRERDRTAGVLGKVIAPADPADADPKRIAAALAPDQGSVDRAAKELDTAARPLLGDPSVRRLYARATACLQRLEQVRAAVRGGWLRQQAAFDSYTQSIDSLLALLPSDAKVGAGGEQVAQPVRAVNTLARVKEITDQFRGRLLILTVTGQLGEQDFQTLSDLKAQRQALLDGFRDGAPGDQLTAYDAMVHGQPVLNGERLAAQLVSEALAGKLTIDAQQWWQASTTELELIRLVETRMLAHAVTGADSRSAAQWRSTLSATAIIVVILLIALLTSWVIGRSMARSLKLLREQALDVAAHRLPEAIERLRTTPRGDPVIDVGEASIDTADEIGEVAQAFTAVHRSAVRLAVEQAMMRRAVNAMFVNLARRSQTLVERQLQLLDNLESAETDPDQLSNLFRLDHLATRMRRNDENLLVLAGADTSRRWSEPVALPAVVLAAMAEIEQYQRIRHDVVGDVHIVGHAVSDVVHLLAELLENATMFSPPGTNVSVSGWRATDTGGATLAIEDRGIGMSPIGVTGANLQLAEPTPIDVATSERMGLLVVANLAARHRIKVELAGTEQGVRAQVWLPAQLLAPPPVHRVANLFGPRQLAAGEAAGGRQPVAAIAGAGTAAETAAGVAIADAADVVAAGPVVRKPGMPTPSAGVPVVTVAGNGASVGRAVARTVGMYASAGSVTRSGLAASVAAGRSLAGLAPFAAQAAGPQPGTGPSGPHPGSGPQPGSQPSGPLPARSPAVSTSGGHPAAPANPAGGGGHAATTANPVATAGHAAPVGSGSQPAPSVPGLTSPDARPGYAPVGQASVPVGHASAPGGAPVGRIRASDGAPSDGRPALERRVPMDTPPTTDVRAARSLPRRATPTRAEDVLGAANPAPADESRWWSKTAPAEPSKPAAPAPRQPVSAGTSMAGLPIRVPMAQLPGDSAVPAQRAPEQPPKVAHEPDPSQVSSVLSSFYGGVRRATAEDESSQARR